MALVFMVRMRVDWPTHLSEAEGAALKAREREYAQAHMRAGKWTHIWRETGRFGNVSIFEVDSHEELHDILSGLPFFPFLTLEVVALSRHPSALNPGR